MEKVRAELAIFFIEESARVTADVILIVCTLIDNSYEPISAREFGQSLQKKGWYYVVFFKFPLIKILFYLVHTIINPNGIYFYICYKAENT